MSKVGRPKKDKCITRDELEIALERHTEWDAKDIKDKRKADRKTEMRYNLKIFGSTITTIYFINMAMILIKLFPEEELIAPLIIFSILGTYGCAIYVGVLLYYFYTWWYGERL